MSTKMNNLSPSFTLRLPFKYTSFVYMGVWTDLQISKMCLIKEIDVRAVETLDKRFFLHTRKGFFFERKVLDRARRNIIKDIHYHTSPFFGNLDHSSSDGAGFRSRENNEQL